MVPGEPRKSRLHPRRQIRMCTEIDHDQPEGSAAQQVIGCTRGCDPVRGTDHGQGGQIDPAFSEIRCVKNPFAGVDPGRGLTLFLGWLLWIH